MHDNDKDMLLGCAGLAEGTNANTFQIANAFHFSIGGEHYLKAATDNIAFATAGDAFAAQADLTTCLYRVMINASGTVQVRQGTPVVTANISASNPVVVPKGKAGFVTIGFLKVVTSGGTFTPASTDLGAAQVTDTYENRQSKANLNS